MTEKTEEFPDYGIINKDGKVIAIFKNERDRDSCYYHCFSPQHYARIRVAKDYDGNLSRLQCKRTKNKR